MNKNQDIFLHRMFLYELSEIIALVITFIIWFIGCGVILNVLDKDESLFLWWLIFSPIMTFNTLNYLGCKYLIKKYGTEMFSDLDQDWLIEHQAFDSKAFGEYFSRSIQCKKFLGVYMFAIITPLSCINSVLAIVANIIYMAVYAAYRDVYFDMAISYKIPRAFGGGGLIVSKIIDNDFKKSVDKISYQLEEKE